jgi:nitrate reductase NapD
LLAGQLTSRPGGAGTGSIHISSAIVSVLPDRRISILNRLAELPDVEVHHVETFKIVIVLEADEAGAIGGRLAEISTWDGVLSANMVFEQTNTQSDFGDR